MFEIWPLGAIMGKLGIHVGYLRKDIAILRIMPHPSTKKRSVGQKATAQRFQLVTKIIATMGDPVNVGFDISGTKRFADCPEPCCIL